MRRPTLWIILLLGWTLSASLAWADDRSEGQTLLDKAVAHYSSGAFHQSIKLLNEAAGVARDPAVLARVHAYLGVNYFVTNARARVRGAFTTALEYDPTLKLALKDVGPSILKLFEATRGSFWGTLSVAAARPGLVVSIDGKRKGPAPWQGKLSIGGHRLSLATADGKWGCQGPVVVRIARITPATCKLKRRTGKLRLVTVPPGATVRHGKRPLGQTPLRTTLPAGKLRLQVSLDGHQELLVTVTVLPGRVAAHQVRLELLSAKPEPPGAGKQAFLAYITLAVGVACLAGAGALYGIGAAKGGEAYDQYREATSGEDYQRHRDDIASARSMLIGGHVLAGAALAAVGFSVYQFVTISRQERAVRSKAGRQRKLRLAPTPGGAVLFVGGQF